MARYASAVIEQAQLLMLVFIVMAIPAVATAGSELLVVDARELQRPGPSYTVDTVAELGEEYREAELFLLVGSDIVGELHRWQRVAEIAERARITVMSRAEAPAAANPKIGIDLLRVEVTHIAVSSSEVRDRIRAGRPYRYLVPAPVYRIIEEHALYRGRP